MPVDASLRGRLIVASPTLVDPNFRKTVVLIAEHSAEGAMGLVLNRRTPASVADAAPHLAELAGQDAAVFVGGPVYEWSVNHLVAIDDPVAPFRTVGPRPVTGEYDHAAW